MKYFGAVKLEKKLKKKAAKEAKKNLEKTFQPPRNHGLVTFNNQNTIFLSMPVKLNENKELTCLLHDNRIFAFEKVGAIGDEETTSISRELLLNMMTTPKYRLMSGLYMIFRLLDNISLLSIIILSIMNGAFTFPSSTNIALISGIGLELFYDVMLQTTKYWVLERLSVHIGILLYVFYFFISTMKYHVTGEYSDDDFKLVATILLTRLMAFILEVCVDIAIDGALHNDLLKLKQQAKDNQGNNHVKPESNDKEHELKVLKDKHNDSKVQSLHPEIQEKDFKLEPKDKEHELKFSEDEHNDSKVQSLDHEIHEKDFKPEPKDKEHEMKPLLANEKNYDFPSWKDMKTYLNISHSIQMPSDINYVGSFLAWSPFSVFTEGVWSKDKFPWWLMFCLVCIPGFIASWLFLLLVILSFLAALIPGVIIYLILACCCCTCKPEEMKDKLEFRNFWKELTHF